MLHGFMGVMYGTKVYAIVVVWCIGMDCSLDIYTGLYFVCHMCSLGLSLYNRPQLRMVLPFGISKFFDVCSPL